MQGSANFAKQFLNIHKPALLLLQETRITSENSKTFFHKLYNKYSNNNDVITFVRKDIWAASVPKLQLLFSNTIIRIQGESTHFHKANL